MPLTEVAIKNAAPESKSKKLHDEKGLYLLIAPNGGKWWRLDYRIRAKRKTISLGVYPNVSLKSARSKRDEARLQIEKEIDPSLERKLKKKTGGLAENCFEQVAIEWFSKFSHSWALSHSDKVWQRLKRNVFPWIGHLGVDRISAKDILEVIQRVEMRGARDTAHRALQNCSQVLRYAVVTGRATHDVSRDLRGSLATATHTHYPSFTTPEEAGSLLRALDAFQGSLVVQSALQLAPLVFVRPGELRSARWDQIDIARAVWSFRVTKTNKDHIVPLSRQAVEILKRLQPLTCDSNLVFPGRDTKKPMSEAAVNAALRRMGFDTITEFTGHGFRAMARTLLDEALGFPVPIIEHQLAHRVQGPLGGAYNRTQFLKERILMMQRWADYLDEIRLLPPGR